MIEIVTPWEARMTGTHSFRVVQTSFAWLTLADCGEPRRRRGRKLRAGILLNLVLAAMAAHIFWSIL